MTPQEICNILLDHYTDALTQVKEQIFFNDVQDCCIAYNVNQGVCTCMASLLGNSSSEMLVNSNMMRPIFDSYKDGGSNWWGTPPRYCHYKYEVVEALEYRIEILKEILSQL